MLNTEGRADLIDVTQVPLGPYWEAFRVTKPKTLNILGGVGKAAFIKFVPNPLPCCSL
jgi:hypothetical protein